MYIKQLKTTTEIKKNKLTDPRSMSLSFNLCVISPYDCCAYALPLLYNKI